MARLERSFAGGRGRNSAVRLRELDSERLHYEAAEPGPGGNGPLLLTPLELLDRLAAPVPPPRNHRHRYFGVLARTAAHWKFRGDPERQELAVSRGSRCAL